MKVPSSNRVHSTTTHSTHGTQGKYVNLRRQNSLRRAAGLKRAESASGLPLHSDSGEEKEIKAEKKKVKSTDASPNTSRTASLSPKPNKQTKTSPTPSPTSISRKSASQGGALGFFFPHSSSSDREYHHDLFADVKLEAILLEVEHTRKNDDMSERVIKFNKSLHKLRSKIRAQISDRTILIEKLKKSKSNILERDCEANAFYDKQELFIKQCNLKLEKYKQIFLEDSQATLYDQIKNIILSHAWPDETNFMGGKYILDEEDNKIAVPSGIEKMTRVIANFPLPDNQRCSLCFGCSFWGPALVSRRTASLELKLEPSEKIDAIKQIITIATNQLKQDKRRGILTRQFYGGLNQIRIDSLDNQQYLETQINLIGTLNGQFGLLDFSAESASPINDDWTVHNATKV